MERKELIHEQESVKGYLIPDEDAVNPCIEFDNLGTVVTWHDRYTLGNEDGTTEYGDPENFKKIAEEGKYLMLPIFLYDHSGLTVSTVPFNDHWDSGQVGYIYVTRGNLKKEYGYPHNLTGLVTKKREEEALEVLKGEVEDLNTYLTGDVWGVVIEKDTECSKCGHQGVEHLDSCWGFFGRQYAEEECKRMFDYVLEKKRKARAEKKASSNG